MVSYLVLFASAFLSATLFPFSSEALLVLLISQGKTVWLLWLCATAGNCLGASVNWLLGRYFLRFKSRKWFPFKPNSLNSAQDWFSKYGRWSLLLSWLPVIGDGITFVAGVMKLSFWQFFLLMSAGKALRYAVVIWLSLGVFKV